MGDCLDRCRDFESGSELKAVALRDRAQAVKYLAHSQSRTRIHLTTSRYYTEKQKQMNEWTFNMPLIRS